MEQLPLLLRQQLRQQFRQRSASYARSFYGTTIYSLPATSPATSHHLRRSVHSTLPHQKQIATHSRKTPEDETHSTPLEQSQQAYPLQGYYLDILSNPYQAYPARRTRPCLPEEKTPPPPEAQPLPTPAVDAQTQPLESTPELTPAQKMSIVFGTRLAGPGYSGSSGRYDPGGRTPESTWHVINGVPIPPRPHEPDNCCMSGCVHCVWDDYRDEVEEWAERVKVARKKGEQQQQKQKEGTRKAKAKGKGKGKKGVITKDGEGAGVVGEMRHKPRREVDNASMSMDDDGGGSEANWDDSIGVGIGEDGDDLFSGIPVGIREFMKTEKRLKEKKRMAAAETER
ncbi:hypothetical protein AJ78_03974 [Emergomyces pasteurianus Ep9510]|uniref:Oxidoreductase-like domain-containing protein n=1 Tax=Emergomyces pasteurianus Ep9510 TaxID=1447872 RepID=A0A1J9PIR5_9EURO|nr:hypothetical protein AJ78_03974 [Emergomyces pasteurianus Ep9510]